MALAGYILLPHSSHLSRLARDTVRDATRDEVDNLKRENERLKQLVADLSLEVHVLKKTEVPGLE